MMDDEEGVEVSGNESELEENEFDEEDCRTGCDSLADGREGCGNPFNN
jgi:hypothetical protein